MIAAPTIAPPRLDQPLSNEQRAAIVLISIGPDHAAMLAKLLGIHAMRRIRRALTDLPHVPETAVFAAFADFITQLDYMRDGLRGGERQAAKMLSEVLGEQLVKEIMKPSVETDPGTAVWTAFGELDPDVIAEFAGRQHGAVAAILLHKLPPTVVPEVLGLMPPNIAVEAIGLLSRSDNPSDAAIAIAERLVERDLLATAGDPLSDPKIVMIGETLGTLPRELREAALKRLDAEDETRAAAIRSALLQIDDIPRRLPTRAVQVVFKDMPRDILVKGLAAANFQAPKVSEFLLGNIAQRMADTFREEIGELPDMDASGQDRAIGAFIREMLSLARSEAITLLPPPTEEERAA
ncbi:MAG: FliG C-terminal domain-containing protein [Litorimonas sp.]